MFWLMKYKFLEEPNYLSEQLTFLYNLSTLYLSQPLPLSVLSSQGSNPRRMPLGGDVQVWLWHCCVNLGTLSPGGRWEKGRSRGYRCSCCGPGPGARTQRTHTYRGILHPADHARVWLQGTHFCHEGARAAPAPSLRTPHPRCPQSS